VDSGDGGQILGGVVLAALASGLAAATATRALGPVWDRVAEHRVARVRPQLQALNIDDSQLATYLRYWGLALLAAALVPAVLLGVPLVTLPVVYFVYIAPDYLLDAQIRRRKTLLRDQMVTASVALANAVKAGLSLPQGFEEVLPETAEPLRTELGRIVRDVRHGRPLQEAIGDVRERLADVESFRMFSAAVLVNLRQGGKVSDTLVRISRSLQENQRLERKLEAETAGGRRVVTILTACPLVFLVGFALIEPATTARVFQSLPGQVVLLLVMLLSYVALYVSRRILDIKI
jgi:tight adherence protein B